MPHDPRQSALFTAAEELPQGLLYEVDFVSPADEAALVAGIEQITLREARFREYFAKRRVAHFHDDAAAPAYDDGGADAFTSGPVPPFLARLRERVASRLGLAPSDLVHALVSEYRPGTPIGWHRDKPVYGIVAGVSLAGVGRMRFRPYAAQDAQHTVGLDVAPRSLYVMRGSIRWQWQHSMLPTKALRYSITLRTRATAAEQARW